MQVAKNPAVLKFLNHFSKSSKVAYKRVAYKKKSCTYRSSRSQMFFQIDVFKNFTNFTEKHRCWSLFLIKLQTCNFIKNRLQHRCFSVTFEKFLRTLFLRKHLPVGASLLCQLFGFSARINQNLFKVGTNTQIMQVCCNATS